jgi:integrase
VLKRINKNLKTIANEIGINPKISFYTARLTFANISRGNQVPDALIGQALGHKQIKSTESYLKRFNIHQGRNPFTSQRRSR